MKKMTEEQKFCKRLLKECIILRDKKGKKLNLAEGLCYQLYYQSGGRGCVSNIARTVRFCATRLGIFYAGYLPKKGKWTFTRRRVLLAMIKCLQDRKLRRELIEGEL